MIRTLSLAAGSFFALSTAAFSAQTVYDCQASNIEAHLGWISDRIIVFVDEGQKSAHVIDQYINYVHEEPIPASYQELKNGKFRIKWKVSGIPVRGEASGSATWSATVSPKTGKMQVRANVSGFDNRPSGHGTCKISREK